MFRVEPILRREKWEVKRKMGFWNIVCWLVGCLFWVSRPEVFYSDVTVVDMGILHTHQLNTALTQSCPELNGTCRGQCGWGL